LCERSAATFRHEAAPGFSVFVIVLEKGGATVAAVGAEEGADVVEPEESGTGPGRSGMEHHLPGEEQAGRNYLTLPYRVKNR